MSKSPFHLRFLWWISMDPPVMLPGPPALRDHEGGGQSAATPHPVDSIAAVPLRQIEAERTWKPYRDVLAKDCLRTLRSWYQDMFWFCQTFWTLNDAHVGTCLNKLDCLPGETTDRFPFRNSSMPHLLQNCFHSLNSGWVSMAFPWHFHPACTHSEWSYPVHLQSDVGATKCHFGMMPHKIHMYQHVAGGSSSSIPFWSHIMTYHDISWLYLCYLIISYHHFKAL